MTAKQELTPSNRCHRFLGVTALVILGAFLGFWRHVATRLPARGVLSFQIPQANSTPAMSTDGANSQSKPSPPDLSKRSRIKHSSQASGTETGHFGQIELVDVGDDTLDFTEFLAQQAGAAHANDQVCLLVTMVPRCPSCASLGYAMAKSRLGNALGKVRIVRLDLDEFEEELRNLHLPIDRVPGIIRLDPDGKVVDFLDATEWNSNDPAEFAPIIEAFVHGRLKQRRHPWVRNP